MFKFIDIAEKIMRITVDTGAGSCVPPPGRRTGADERERHRERPRQDIVLVKKVEAARKRKRIARLPFQETNATGRLQPAEGYDVL